MIDRCASITIRSMTRDEMENLTALWTESELSHRPHGRDRYPQLLIQWEKNRDGFIGAFDGERLIGSAVVTDDGRRGWINRIAVHPDYRRRGVAGLLIAESENRLSARGLMVWAALIDEDNDSSRLLFESAGYEQLSEVLYYCKRSYPDA